MVRDPVKNTTTLLARTLNRIHFAAPNKDVQNVLNINALTRFTCYCDDQSVNLIYNVFPSYFQCVFFFKLLVKPFGFFILKRKSLGSLDIC